MEAFLHKFCQSFSPNCGKTCGNSKYTYEGPIKQVRPKLKLPGSNKWTSSKSLVVSEWALLLCRLLCLLINQLRFFVQEQRWNNRQMRFLIMECLLYTINLFADHPDVVPSAGARNFKLQCDNCVASCLLDLQTQGNVAALVDRFQSVESKLEAMRI